MHEYVDLLLAIVRRVGARLDARAGGPGVNSANGLLYSVPNTVLAPPLAPQRLTLNHYKRFACTRQERKTVQPEPVRASAFYFYML